MQEITPLTPDDCFTIVRREKKAFDFPLHHHTEYELNFLVGAQGAKRVVGGHIGVLDDVELVLIGPNVYHAWFNHQCRSETITEVTIQFHKDLFDDKFLNRNQMAFIRNMLELAQRGISFHRDAILKVKERLLALDQKKGFESVLELLSILHSISVAPGMKPLSDPAFGEEKFSYRSQRIEKVYQYMNANYTKVITLAEVAKVVSMPEASFSRFIKKSTGKTFIDSLNEIRLGHASRMLIDSSSTVSEIAYKCGFNNISNFNRIFKRKKFCIPKQFRETYTGNRIFV